MAHLFFGLSNAAVHVFGYTETARLQVFEKLVGDILTTDVHSVQGVGQSVTLEHRHCISHAFSHFSNQTGSGTSGEERKGSRVLKSEGLDLEMIEHEHSDFDFVVLLTQRAVRHEHIHAARVDTQLVVKDVLQKQTQTVNILDDATLHWVVEVKVGLVFKCFVAKLVGDFGLGVAILVVHSILHSRHFFSDNGRDHHTWKIFTGISSLNVARTNIDNDNLALIEANLHVREAFGDGAVVLALDEDRALRALGVIHF